MKILKWLLFAILSLVAIPFAILGTLGLLALAFSVLAIAVSTIIPIAACFFIAAVGIIFALEFID